MACQAELLPGVSPEGTLRAHCAVPAAPLSAKLPAGVPENQRWAVRTLGLLPRGPCCPRGCPEGSPEGSPARKQHCGSCSSLGQPQLLQPFGDCTSRWETCLSVSLPLYLSKSNQKIKIFLQKLRFWKSCIW